jgi:hypothetical protein
MWQWYHIRAQELIRERVAEADAWRQARAAAPARRATPPSRLPTLARRFLQAGR